MFHSQWHRPPRCTALGCAFWAWTKTENRDHAMFTHGSFVTSDGTLRPIPPPLGIRRAAYIASCSHPDPNWALLGDFIPFPVIPPPVWQAPIFVPVVATECDAPPDVFLVEDPPVVLRVPERALRYQRATPVGPGLVLGFIPPEDKAMGKGKLCVGLPPRLNKGIECYDCRARARIGQWNSANLSSTRH